VLKKGSEDEMHVWEAVIVFKRMHVRQAREKRHAGAHARRR
jgi:hypothetical protein